MDTGVGRAGTSGRSGELMSGLRLTFFCYAHIVPTNPATPQGRRLSLENDERVHNCAKKPANRASESFGHSVWAWKCTINPPHFSDILPKMVSVCKTELISLSRLPFPHGAARTRDFDRKRHKTRRYCVVGSLTLSNERHEASMDCCRSGEISIVDLAEANPCSAHYYESKRRLVRSVTLSNWHRFWAGYVSC